MSFIPKKFVYDKVVLLLASVLAFLVFVTIISVVIRLATGQGATDYFVEYRSNTGINAFKTGDLLAVISFIVFSVFVLISTLVLSVRIYLIKRELSIITLSFGIVLTLLAAIVSNALLALR